MFFTEPEGALSSSQQAKATMFYNLATVFCVLKEHEKAKQSLQKVLQIHNYLFKCDCKCIQAAALFTGHIPELVLLSAYIELARG